MMNTVIRIVNAIGVVATTAVLLAGCTGGNHRMQDAAGLTAQQVAGQSLHQEFDRYRDRYEHMQTLLADAQRVVDDGEWQWGGGDDIPRSGGDGGATASALYAADDHNSYYLHSARLRFPEGGHGAKSDLAPMQAYFESQHWATTVNEVGPRYYLVGVTDEGWQFSYMVQPSGQYALTISSDLYWTNDWLALSRAIANRVTVSFPVASRPGAYPPLPKWDAPVSDEF